MRTILLGGLLVLVSACTTSPVATETGATQGATDESPAVVETDSASSRSVPYQVRIVFGQRVRYESPGDPESREKPPQPEKPPATPSRSVLSALVELIGGYTETYRPGRTMDEQGTPVLEDSLRSLEDTKVVELWLKGQKRPWRVGETVECNGWKLKLLSGRRSAEGYKFGIEVLREGTEHDRRND